MIKLFIYTFILSLWHSFLFYGNNLGLSVILFTLPIIGLILYTLFKYKKVNNRYGLLFVVPIITCSLNYLLFDVNLFKILNIILIPLFFILMSISCINGIDSVSSLFTDIGKLLFKPFSCFYKVNNIIKENIKIKVSFSRNFSKILIGLLVTLPIIFIIIILLARADMVFANLFKNIVTFIENIFKYLSLVDIIKRLALITLTFLFIASTINYLAFNLSKEKVNNVNKNNEDNYIIKILFTSLNIIYLIFVIIQVKSLFLHSISEAINYAEYARTGFFQLMIVSLINIGLLLIAKKCESNNPNHNKYPRLMSTIMLLLTTVIIASSFLRMVMYANHFGYTILRLLVFSTLITETFLLIPTMGYIHNSKLNILKYYVSIITIAYATLNVISFNDVIANNNINHYYKTGKIDLYYLHNNDDNINELVDFYLKTDDLKVKNSLRYYLKNYDIENNNIREFNFANHSARKALEKIK